MLILCINDVGVHATGLKGVEELARELSDDVWVVAHELDQSGDSHSLSLNDRLGLMDLCRRNPYFWIGFDRVAQADLPAEGTDLWALGAHYVSVTPLRLDRTDDEFSEELTATLK